MQYLFIYYLQIMNIKPDNLVNISVTVQTNGELNK